MFCVVKKLCETKGFTAVASLKQHNWSRRRRSSNRPINKVAVGEPAAGSPPYIFNKNTNTLLGKA
jgi:hypothetical protein